MKTHLFFCFRKTLFFWVWSCFLIFPLFSEEVSETEEDLWEDIMEDPGLTVVGTPETTQQKKVIDKEEIDQRQAPDLAALLEEVLDLPVSRYGAYGNGTSISIRGFDSERIAILIDGIPVNSALSGEFDISSLDMNTIERIEVIYGGSDTKYNVTGAFGGVINIITVKKSQKGLRLGGTVSNTSALPGKYRRDGEVQDPKGQDLFDTQRLALSAGLGREQFSLRGNIFTNRAGNHYLYKDYYDITRRKEHNEVWDLGGSASIVWDLPELSKLIVSGDISYGDKNIPISGTASIAAKQKNISSRQNILLDMPWVVREDLAMEASLSHAWADLDYVQSSTVSSHHTEHTITAINRWSWYLREDLAFRAGGDYRFSYLDSTNIGTQQGHDGGIYLTGEYQPIKIVKIIPSVKLIFNKNSATLVPKLGFIWFALDSFTLKNNYYRSFKFPDFEDLYWVQDGFYGNPDLKPEDGWGADLVAEYRWRDWLVESTGYANWTKDSIHWSNKDGTWKPQNVGEAAFFGWDSRIRGAIPVPFGPVTKLIPSLSYHLLISYLLTGDLTLKSNRRMPYMPMHTLGISLEVPWKTGSFLISGHYEGLRYTETQNIIKLPPHFLLNLTLNQKIGNQITAFLVMRNLLNQSYNSMYDYPMPGLTLTLGVKTNLDFY